MPPGEESTRNSGSMSMKGETAGNPVKTSETASNQMTGAPDPRMGGSGQGGMIELLRVQMETGELNIRLALLKELLITERTKFNSILNREPGSGVFINDSLPLANLPGSISNLADSIDHNPMVRMYVADREANEARIKMAEKMGYPMIGLGLSYTVIQKFPEINSMMNGKDMVMPMVTATLPVYRKKYRAQKLEAGYLRDAADESAGYAKNNLQVNFREAVQLYEDAGRRAELYTRQATLAGRTITLLTRSFSVAGTDFEEILRMQQQLLDYEFKRIEALVDSNRAAATIQSIVSHR
jgi:outer membrane protein TolC